MALTSPSSQAPKEENIQLSSHIWSKSPEVSGEAMEAQMEGSAAKTAICMRACSVASAVSLFAIPRTVACQAPLSMEWVATGIFPTWGLNPHLLWLLHCGQILYFWATGEAQIATIENKSDFCPFQLRLIWFGGKRVLFLLFSWRLSNPASPCPLNHTDHFII